MIRTDSSSQNVQNYSNLCATLGQLYHQKMLLDKKIEELVRHLDVIAPLAAAEQAKQDVKRD